MAEQRKHRMQRLGPVNWFDAESVKAMCERINAIVDGPDFESVVFKRPGRENYNIGFKVYVGDKKNSDRYIDPDWVV